MLSQSLHIWDEEMWYSVQGGKDAGAKEPP